jgi:hypothetical protein
MRIMCVMQRLIIYVDVDDTLVRSTGSKRIPIPATIEHFRQLALEGADSICGAGVGQPTRNRQRKSSDRRMFCRVPTEAERGDRRRKHPRMASPFGGASGELPRSRERGIPSATKRRLTSGRSWRGAPSWPGAEAPCFRRRLRVGGGCAAEAPRSLAANPLARHWAPPCGE